MTKEKVVAALGRSMRYLAKVLKVRTKALTNAKVLKVRTTALMKANHRRFQTMSSESTYTGTVIKQAVGRMVFKILAAGRNQCLCPTRKQGADASPPYPSVFTGYAGSILGES